MNKATPGPWEVVESNHVSLQIHSTAPSEFSGSYVAEIVNPEEVDERDFANGNLIAAAPDLLKECESALYDLTRFPRLSARRKERLVERLTAAIAKAAGNNEYFGMPEAKARAIMERAAANAEE